MKKKLYKLDILCLPTVTKALYDWWMLEAGFEHKIHFTYLLTYLLSFGNNMWNPVMWSETVGLRIRPL